MCRTGMYHSRSVPVAATRPDGVVAQAGSLQNEADRATEPRRLQVKRLNPNSLTSAAPAITAAELKVPVNITPLVSDVLEHFACQIQAAAD
jgi:hypothetical protein